VAPAHDGAAERGEGTARLLALPLSSVPAWRESLYGDARPAARARAVTSCSCSCWTGQNPPESGRVPRHRSASHQRKWSRRQRQRQRRLRRHAGRLQPRQQRPHHQPRRRPTRVHQPAQPRRDLHSLVTSATARRPSGFRVE
jgi:hypothetical protein